MKIAIHQPNYLPWIGYFYKLANCDTFVYLDNVQYTKNSYINRSKIKTPQGALWSTVPVSFKFGQLINEVSINNKMPWRKKQLRTIEMNYKKVTHFDEIYDLLKSVYDESEWQLLSELNMRLANAVCEYLDIKTKTINASSLGASGASTDLLIDIIKKTNGNTYLSGKGGANYQDEEKFKRNGISLSYTDFTHSNYSQLWGEFLEGMSIIDLLFNCGKESLKYILHTEKNADEYISL